MTNSESTITKNFSNQLEIFGITPSSVHRNLAVAKLVDIAIQKNEGIVTSTGSLSVKTDGVRIGHGVGTKKRTEIVVKAIEKKYKVFNARVSAIGRKS